VRAVVLWIVADQAKPHEADQSNHVDFVCHSCMALDYVMVAASVTSTVVACCMCICDCNCCVLYPQAEQQQLGQQLTAQLQELHRVVQSGAAVDPVAMAAVASAAASTGLSSCAAAAADLSTAADVTKVGQVSNAGVRPAVAVAFLRELAAFGKSAAAGKGGLVNARTTSFALAP
jgi:hypothetical protein